ncbi:MAG: TonB-dependent receptor [Janthinobacterium lividum]
MPRLARLCAALLAAAPLPAAADPAIPIAPVHAASGAAQDSPTTQPLDATQPTSVTSRAALDRYVAPTGGYDDAIRLSPSVIDVSPNGPGLGEAQILAIRGFVDGQYNVTLDGIPFADSDDFTHHSSAYFVARDLASVTVDRGPGSAATLGDATFGGTIALRSIAPSAAAPTISPTVSLGSFATRSGGVLLDSGLALLPGGATGVLDLESARSDGALSLAAQRRATAFGKLVVPLGPDATLTLAANASRTTQNEPPGATRARIAALGPSTALNADPRSQAYAGYNSSAYRTDIAYATLAATPNPALTLSDTLYTYGLERRFRQGLDPNGETPNGTALSPADVPGQSLRNGLRAWGAILRAVQTLPAALTLEAGLWAERQTNSRSSIEIDLSAGGTPNPVLPTVPGTPGSASIDRLQHESLLTVQPYAQLGWRPRPWLTLTAGLKGAWSARDIDAPVMQGTRLPTRVSRGFGAALPSLTALLRPTPRWSLYAQAARGFLAPRLQLFDVTDPRTAPIAPERTTNLQLGTAWRSHGLAASADLYAILFDDAVGVRTIAGNATVFPEGRVTYRGAEAEATQSLGAGLSLYASGSLNQSHQAATADSPGGPAPSTPQFTLSAGLLLTRDRLTASLIERRTGGSYGDTGRAQWIAPYGQLDAAAGTTLRLGPTPLALRLQAFNLLNGRKADGLAGYTLAAGTPLFWTQAGTSMFASATARF